jgi:hypothetical protein
MKRLALLVLLASLCVSPALAATITEDWNCADNNSLTCDVTWNEFGSASAAAFGIASNRAAYNATGGNDANAYTNTNLTTNHYVQVKVATLTHAAGALEVAGVVCRKSTSSAITGYYWEAWRSDSLNEHRLYKRTAGAEVLLGTDSTDHSANEVLKLECDGTNITARVNGTLASFGVIGSQTDHSSNVRQGIFGFYDGGVTSGIALDDFESGDITSASRAGRVPIIVY